MQFIKGGHRADRLVTGRSPHSAFTDLLDDQQGKSIIQRKATRVEKEKSMTWTTPKTDWATGELVTAEDMNAIGENLADLKTPVATAYVTTAATHIANSSDFADIGSNFNLTIDTAGGDVLVHFHASINEAWIMLDVEVDGVRHGDATTGIRSGGVSREFVSFTRLIQGLSPGTHTFKLQARNAPATIQPGAQFWVREL